MKKTKLLMAACLMLFVFGSCGNGQNQTEKEDNKDNEVTAVTSSPDLAFFGLQGPVKSCNDVMAPTGQFFDCIEYDQSGNIASVDGYNPFTIEKPWSEINEETSTLEEHCRWIRDDQGQISSFDCDMNNADFTWENGHVSLIWRDHEDMTYRHENEYDSEGRLVKQTIYGGTIDEVEDNEMVLYYVMEYKYLEIDNHGNWTRCMVKCTDYEIDYEDEEELTRTIKYFE